MPPVSIEELARILSFGLLDNAIALRPLERRDYTLTTMPCVSATMTPSIAMNAVHPASSRMFSFSASLLCGGRKNAAGMSFVSGSSVIRGCRGCRRRWHTA